MASHGRTYYGVQTQAAQFVAGAAWLGTKVRAEAAAKSRAGFSMGPVEYFFNTAARDSDVAKFGDCMTKSFARP